jgi:uncharacterized protein YbjT (DUF2867 family)
MCSNQSIPVQPAESISIALRYDWVMKIAVAGGTGVVGSLVVAELTTRGHEAVVLARAAGVDLLTGDGLAERLEGVRAVVDVTSTPTSSKKRATHFFTTATANLLQAEQTAGVEHHVLLSIVGIDVTPFGYYLGKLAQENLVEAGDVPWTIVRAPQFHEFAGQLLERAAVGPVAIVPRMVSAPMAAAEVAEVLVDLALGTSQGHAPELRGPEVLEMSDLVKQVSRRLGPRKLVLTARMFGQVGRGMAGGALVADDPGTIGRQTFGEWLEKQS